MPCCVYQATARARLGGKAQRCLKKGQAVEDQVLVDILTEAIRYAMSVVVHHWSRVE